MGSFSNTVFSILLGWIQTVSTLIWSYTTSADGKTLFDFIEKNWIIMAAFLCIFGAAADLVIYFFRWRPYKVWFTWIRNLRRKFRKNDNDSEQEYNIRESDSFSSAVRNQGAEIPDSTKKGTQYVGQSYDKTIAEDLTTQEETDEYPIPYLPELKLREENLRNGYNSRRRRARMSSFFGDSEENYFHYEAPQPVFDQKETYHTPVYPKNWKKNEDHSK